MGKLLKRLRYPKLLLMILTFAVAYVIFSGRSFPPLHALLLNSGYIGVFAAGMLYSYGFTAAPATAMLLIMSAWQQNIIVSAVIAGVGSLLADLLIFKFVRHSFADEVGRLSRERLFINVNKRMPLFLKVYLIPIMALFIIASPLPDEIGVSMMAMTKVGAKAFCALSYLLNTVGILAILGVGSII